MSQILLSATMPPIDHALNLTTQAILTYASWALTAVILLLTVRMGLRERTPFYPLMVLAAMAGAFAEPLYDVAMMLYFYSGPDMWTHLRPSISPAHLDA